MLIPKKNLTQIYEYLFKEGVLVAPKSLTAVTPHKEIPVPNLQVIKACQSLRSRGHVREIYNWRYFYFTLTNEGIQYLRDYLHLPPEIVPATLKRQARPVDTRARPKVDEPRRAYGNNTGDRDAYRRAAGQAGGDRGPDKKADAGAGTATFEFRGGYGRGRGGGPQ